MEYYSILGMVTASVILFGGFYFTVYRNAKQNAEEANSGRQKQIDAIHSQTKETIKLTLAIEHMNENIVRQEKRISKHGGEIDALNKVVSNHEGRIGVLESK